MSIRNLTVQNDTSIYCKNFDCKNMICSKMLMPPGADLDAHNVFIDNDLIVQTQDGLNNIKYNTPNIGSAGYQLTVDINGNTYWGQASAVGGVDNPMSSNLDANTFNINNVSKIENQSSSLELIVPNNQILVNTQALNLQNTTMNMTGVSTLNMSNNNILNANEISVNGLLSPTFGGSVSVNSDIDMNNNDIKNTGILDVDTITSSGFNVNIDKGIIQRANNYDNVLTLRDTATTDADLAIGYIYIETNNGVPVGAFGAVGTPGYVEVLSYSTRDVRIDANNSKYVFTRDDKFNMPPNGIINTTTLNTSKINEIFYITTQADLPNPITAGTYIICGNITLTTSYTITGDVSFVGYGRDLSSLNFVIPTGQPSFYALTILDNNVSFNNLKLTNQSDTHNLLAATNSALDKILTFTNCFITNCKNVVVIDITGFDLVDFNQTLFMYNYPTGSHLDLINVSKLQISSCEFLRQLNKANPTQYGTASMIGLFGSGFGAINIAGCLIHPQQTQNGIFISNSQSALENVISGNTFIQVGLTTGLLLNYDVSLHPELVIDSNSGVLNEKANIEGNEQNNSVYTTTVAGQYVGINVPTITFPMVNRFSTATGLITYLGKAPITILINANILANQDDSKDNNCRFGLEQNGVLVSSIGLLVETNKNRSFSYTSILQVVQNDTLEFVCQNIDAGSSVVGFRVIDLNATLIEV